MCAAAAAAAAATMPRSLSCTKITAWTLAAVVLQILGLSLFVIGFFPVKPTLPGFSGPESYRMPTCDSTMDKEEVDLPPDQLKSLYREMSKITPAFDRLVLMVVDGLPAEFVLGRGDKPPTKTMLEAMPYTQYLLSNRRATAYHAKAAPPTVTMPRLKAMVSGAVGGFLDVAFNFNTQALLDDNLLDQFKRIGWKLVMLGDETWIKLFPGLFMRQDGVSSFYVKDTVEVDFNVSRHLEFELAAKDWSLLILHYLGLDHVGHIGGRHSNLMAPKLKEMDEVIQMIQENLDEHTLLVVVSDHGMTDGGNHGGSSFEETDSLVLFTGLRTEVPDYLLNMRKGAFQVDIAPTLALLFGVPIPKNNVGVLLAESFASLTDEQILRALELNSWQLLRLLQAHLPSLLCGNSSCSFSYEHGLLADASFGTTMERLCCLFSRAMTAHKIWVLHHDSSFISNNTDDLMVAIGSYYEFLRNASEWLSRRATDKPDNLLFSGISVMLISCVLLLILLFHLLREVHFLQKQPSSQAEKGNPWHLDEAFVFVGTLIHVLSLGASSMVEEEQYTWHFLASTLSLIFLYETIRSILRGKASHSTKLKEGVKMFSLKQLWASNSNDSRSINFRLTQLKNMPDYYQLSLVLVILICGRVLRGWYQGGVNWVHLPDVSKWLEQAGISTIRVFQIIAVVLVMVLSSFTFSLVRSRRSIVRLVLVSHFLSGILVLLHIMKTQSHDFVPVDYSSTILAQLFYMIVGLTMIITMTASPWVLPVHYCETYSAAGSSLNSCSINKQPDSLVVDIQDSMYLIGWTCTASWCLLQLLLQQPVNAVPIVLLFVQLLASILYFSSSESQHEQWVEVAAIQFLGMAGHFGLGNSNSLATIDVAGAFIGISNHSTVLSGILMFISTYASPLLSLLSMVVYISIKEMRSPLKKSELSCILKMMIVFPCVLPLVLNSVVLTAFTIILLLMRNHLFVWSVFSPKYLYICASTLSIYIGVCIVAATGFYVCVVILFRRGGKCFT